MKTYTVRRPLTDAPEATMKGHPMSIWQTYAEASKEVDRLYAANGTEAYITLETT